MSATSDAIKTSLTIIRANSSMLRDCHGPHDFERVPDKEGAPTFRCKLCKGEVHEHSLLWYLRGLEHGRQIVKGQGQGIRE